MPADLQSVKIPRPAPPTLTSVRPPKKNIPQTKTERDALLRYIREYMETEKPVPPMPLDELEVHARKVLEATGFADIYLHYTAVCLSNEMWRETMAAIPFERRLLLMPKCLRVEDKCPAPFDEFGLLCKSCGLCTIQDFQEEAERLGYAVLVAEGSAVVMSLIQTGKIEAIVGVSCLPVLERTFPYVEAAAIPSIAVPLLQDDCINTTVDNDWVWDYIHLTSDDKTRRLDLTALHEEVRTWFTEESLTEIMGEPEGETERLARASLAGPGKRWRPFLTVAAFQALRETPEDPIPLSVKQLAAAVECFHKASLIHDDIEDGDATRYDEPTAHEQHGTPVALNLGDLLIGEGYRLIGAADLPAEAKSQCLTTAAEGQRSLCRGQGAELLWARNPLPLKSREVLDIFRQKTAPAFEVALRCGASAAGKLDEVADVLSDYSENLGIAYQIRDDLADAAEDTVASCSGSPNILFAVANEKAKAEDDKQLLETLWSRGDLGDISSHKLQRLAHDLKADDRCTNLLETYKEAATRSLTDLQNPNLKGLLRRTLGKIFNDLEIKGWCHEFEPEE
ncbi:polyprenyl synthetase family protein [Verrucomicrobiales bacterium]|nr:polyprenyl synthetase family protein [Verrucomicrobiales bacterium]